MGSTGSLPFTSPVSSPHSPSPPLDIKTVLRICDSTFSSFLDRFQAFDRNGSVNYSKVVFLTTCFVAMAGCGILTSLLRRKSSQQPPSGLRRFRRFARKDRPKTAAGTVTSSDEEDYDSNGSLRLVNGSISEKDGTSQQNLEQTPEGLSVHSSWATLSILFTDDSSSDDRSRSSQETFFVPLLHHISCHISIYQNVLLSTSTDEQAAF